jgi:hypothetical protein
METNNPSTVPFEMRLFSLHFLATIGHAGGCWAAIHYPIVTAAPQIHEALEKRASGATCGYVDGNPGKVLGLDYLIVTVLY